MTDNSDLAARIRTIPDYPKPGIMFRDVSTLLLDGPGAIPLALSHLTIKGIGSIAFMAYIATLFGFGAWAWLLSRYPASQVVPFALFVPVAGIAGAGLILGEAVTEVEIVGSVLVFAGLLINVFGPRLFKRAPA